MATKNTNTATVVSGNKTLTQAIQTKDLQAISLVVASADKIIYDAVEVALKAKDLAGIPAIVNSRIQVEPVIETVYGPLKLTAVYDDDTKWEAICAEYIFLSPKIDRIINSDSKNKTLEVAKVIAGSDVLRYVTAAPVASVDGLF